MEEVRTDRTGMLKMPGKYSEKVYEAFYILLRAGLWEKEPDGFSVFPLSQDEWKTVYDMARSQTVMALVYQGVSMLPEKFLPPLRILLKWVTAVDWTERRNREMNRTLNGICKLFCENGIVPVLQKGQGVASFYSKPLFRECGDIDLYFRSDGEMKKALKIAAESGCDVSCMPDGSSLFRYDNTEVEIHPFLIDICNPFNRKYIEKIKDNYGYTGFCPDGGDVEISVPSAFLNILLLDTHILKHALGWGIGLRQICDMARACYSLHDSYDKAEMRYCCGELGIRKWTRLLNAFMTDRLGLDRKFLPFDEREKSAWKLERIVTESGNFGMERDGRKNGGKGTVASKIGTVRSFSANMGFALKYAPAEGFWTFAALVKGQL